MELATVYFYNHCADHISGGGVVRQPVEHNDNIYSCSLETQKDEKRLDQRGSLPIKKKSDSTPLFFIGRFRGGGTTDHFNNIYVFFTTPVQILITL